MCIIPKRLGVSVLFSCSTGPAKWGRISLLLLAMDWSLLILNCHLQICFAPLLCIWVIPQLPFSSCSHFNYSFLSKTQPRALACTRSCIKETQTPWLKATISSSAGTRMHALIEQRNGKSNARSLICVSVCL